jgi:hypothetical protein
MSFVSCTTPMSSCGPWKVGRSLGHSLGGSVIEFTGVTTLRKGRVVVVEFFWDHAEALETLGLSE